MGVLKALSHMRDGLSAVQVSIMCVGDVFLCRARWERGVGGTRGAESEKCLM